MSQLEAIVWKDGQLKILDQLLLPTKSVHLRIETVQQGWQAIQKMQVRGAPAIAIVGCLSIAAELQATLGDESPGAQHPDCESLHNYVSFSLAHLVTARPTAVNMRTEADALTKYSSSVRNTCTVAEMKVKLIEWCKNLLAEDVATNKRLGDHGMQSILDDAQKESREKVTLVTICNTGSLATAGYGTALGVVRSLHAKEKLGGLFMLETRPYMQGARLTAFEAVVENWPNSTLVCDGAVGALLNTHKVDAAVVGADRVAANGDTANKIGTYQLAVLCAAHKVPFYVCTTATSIDMTLESGAAIPIEHRPQEEMTRVAGHRVAAPGIKCWNPAFDVTPARLITGGIVTEFGVFRPDQLKEAMASHNK
uniref:Methylthioribose-1-phosphate isomerase n=1 Tax=Hirondellea gigas TaxID=1518452 RepID=A0A2P2HXP3_9CRUS